jgi:hypothetical protein
MRRRLTQLPSQPVDGGNGLNDIGVDIWRTQAGLVRVRPVFAGFRFQLQTWIEQPLRQGLENSHRMLLAGYTQA